jgi:drug/metabolite transporter (DMT)-like permease
MPSRPSRTAWLRWAITAAVCWGIWGVLAKGPSRELSGWMTQVLFTFALIPSAFVAARSKRLAVGTDKRWGILWGFVSGLFAGAGDLSFCLALQSGADTAVAIPLISLYPLVTLPIACCWFKERLNRTQGVGIVLAITAILLLSGDMQSLSRPLETLHRTTLSPWLIYTLVALICAGLFTATQKVSTNFVSAEMSYLAWCGALALIALGVVISRPLNWNMPASQVGAALVAGTLNGFGVIAAFAAYRNEGKAAVVAPLTATLQPLVTVLLALLFLGERLGALDGCGIVLAILAAAALSSETKKPHAKLKPSPSRLAVGFTTAPSQESTDSLPKLPT